MKRLVVTLCILAAASLTAAAEETSVDKGKQLFSDPQLGSNGKSCNSCHPDGKGLSMAGEYEMKDVSRIINKCIEVTLQGKALEMDSVELGSLVKYIKSLPPEKGK